MAVAILGVDQAVTVGPHNSNSFYLQYCYVRTFLWTQTNTEPSQIRRKFSRIFALNFTGCLFFQLPGGYFVRPFPTHHRVPSQGYLVYKQNKRLKSEYQGLPGPEIGKLAREGVNIHDVVITPEIAYTGQYFHPISRQLWLATKS